ncbi:MAG: TRAP transporter substrate-binding protein DctP [Paracoccaceae bacterium]
MNIADVKVLGIFTVAGDSWAATKDVSTVAGLSGAKFVPYAALTTPIFEAMGATPVQMPVTEMYTGLSTGTIDAATTAFSNMTPPWNFWEVSTYLVENVPVRFAVFFVVMNKERYMELSDAHRAIIDALAGEVFSRKGAESFHVVDTAAYLAMETAPEMARVTRVNVAADEREKMDAAVAVGLEAIFSDYEARGISNAREIYSAINQ